MINSSAVRVRPSADGVSERVSHVVEKWPKLPNIKYLPFITGHIHSDCDSLPPPQLFPQKWPFWRVLAEFLRKKEPSLSLSVSLVIYALPSPQRNFWACFIAFGVAKKNIARRREKAKGRMDSSPTLSSVLSLLLPVKQLLMICRQMVSGRPTSPSFHRLALLQTGGWERSTMSYAPFLFKVETFAQSTLGYPACEFWL